MDGDGNRDIGSGSGSQGASSCPLSCQGRPSYDLRVIQASGLPCSCAVRSLCSYVWQPGFQDPCLPQRLSYSILFLVF